MRKHPASSQQLGFDSLLFEAAQTNHARKLENQTRHLPATMVDALPFFAELLQAHHDAMLGAMVDEAMFCRDEAHRLAVKLNGGKAGILADQDSPGYVLARETAAAPGTVPLWGQKGSFIISANSVPVRIEMEGMFGICAGSAFWLGFSAHVVDTSKPFISETGYRSFLGIHAEPVPGLAPDTFAAKVIAGHVAREMKGRLVAISTNYRAPLATSSWPSSPPLASVRSDNGALAGGRNWYVPARPSRSPSATPGRRRRNF